MNKNNIFLHEFSIHHYIKNNDHSIKSHTLNKSQDEFYFLIKEIASTLNIKVHVRTFAPKEGGFVHFLKFVGDNASSLTILSSLLIAVAGGSAWLIYQRPLLNQQHAINAQQINKNNGDREKDKLELEKLKIELDRLKKEESKNDSENKNPIPNTNNLILNFEPNIDHEAILNILKSNKKIIRRLSNFYEQIDSDADVEAIGYSDEKYSEEVVVNRANFQEFIVKEINLEDEVLEGICIEITSPVLNNKNIKWHGVYEKQNINFSLNDNNFKNSVLAKIINFRNGSKIKCDLRRSRRINNVGDIEIYDHSAENVASLD